MIYLLYEAARRKLIEAEKTLDGILTEKQAAIREGQDTGQYAKRLKDARSLVKDREELLDKWTKKLRDSSDIHDRVFVMRMLDGIRVYKIAAACSYSEAQIYRILGDIKKSLDAVKDDR